MENIDRNLLEKLAEASHELFYENLHRRTRKKIIYLNLVQNYLKKKKKAIEIM